MTILLSFQGSAEKSLLSRGTSDNENSTPYPFPPPPLSTFAFSIFLAPSAASARPVRQESLGAQKAVKAIKVPESSAERRSAIESLPSSLLGLPPLPSSSLLPIPPAVCARLDRPSGAGILRLAVELPRAIALESNFHSDLLFEQG